MSRRKTKKARKAYLRKRETLNCIFIEWVNRCIEADRIADKNLKILLNMPDFWVPPLIPEECVYEWNIMKNELD